MVGIFELQVGGLQKGGGLGSPQAWKSKTKLGLQAWFCFSSTTADFHWKVPYRGKKVLFESNFNRPFARIYSVVGLT
jgi:hypothetical protein